MFETNFLDYFEISAWAVALGQAWVISQDLGDDAMGEAILCELECCKESVIHLELCLLNDAE